MRIDYNLTPKKGINMSFKIKMIIAYLFDFLGISAFWLKKLNEKYKNQYIRIVNYHETPFQDADNFEKQIVWYKAHFDNVDYAQFEAFLSTGSLPGAKPGIMISFDDGFEDNYSVAKGILEKYGMTGYFMVSSDKLVESATTYSARVRIFSRIAAAPSRWILRSSFRCAPSRSRI